MRIRIDVELRPWRAVAERGKGTAHGNDPADAARDIRMLDERQRNIGHRPDGADGDLFAGIHCRTCGSHDELHRIFFFRHNPAGLDQRIIESADAGIFAKHLLAHQRPAGAGIDRHATPAAQANQLAGIDDGVVQRHVAGNDGQAQNLDLRRGERHQDGGGVIDAGIRIDDDLMRFHATTFSA